MASFFYWRSPMKIRRSREVREEKRRRKAFPSPPSRSSRDRSKLAGKRIGIRHWNQGEGRRVASNSGRRPGRATLPLGCPASDFSSAPDGFPARKNDMGRAPRDFSAPKRAAGCSPFAWGRAPKHSGCAPCRWSRARMIRGLPPAIFPLPRTVFPSPRAIGVRPEAFFGAQKPLGARPKPRKILQLRQKTGFLPFFIMKIPKGTPAHRKCISTIQICAGAASPTSSNRATPAFSDCGRGTTFGSFRNCASRRSSLRLTAVCGQRIGLPRGGG